MSAVVKSGSIVKRTATAGSPTIQQFLSHLRGAGVDWVPEPLGFDDSGREILSFVEGQAIDGVPPEWFWDENVLVDIAKRLRQLHDASISFDGTSAVWNWDSASPTEVILHRDFAPYNCIFREQRFVGLIDFDLCAPGPRIWDIAYTAYRFVPLMPIGPLGHAQSWSVSPFNTEIMIKRLDAFLVAYGLGAHRLEYSTADVLAMTIKRLDAMIEWIKMRLQTHPNPGLAENAETYAAHRAWLAGICPVERAKDA